MIGQSVGITHWIITSRLRIVIDDWSVIRDYSLDNQL